MALRSGHDNLFIVRDDLPKEEDHIFDFCDPMYLPNVGDELYISHRGAAGMDGTYEGPFIVTRREYGVIDSRSAREGMHLDAPRVWTEVIVHVVPKEAPADA